MAICRTRANAMPSDANALLGRRAVDAIQDLCEMFKSAGQALGKRIEEINGPVKDEWPDDK